jgi:hypothetical protein
MVCPMVDPLPKTPSALIIIRCFPFEKIVY